MDTVDVLRSSVISAKCMRSVPHNAQSCSGMWAVATVAKSGNDFTLSMNWSNDIISIRLSFLYDKFWLQICQVSRFVTEWQAVQKPRICVQNEHHIDHACL